MHTRFVLPQCAGNVLLSLQTSFIVTFRGPFGDLLVVVIIVQELALCHENQNHPLTDSSRLYIVTCSIK